MTEGKIQANEDRMDKLRRDAVELRSGVTAAWNNKMPSVPVQAPPIDVVNHPPHYNQGRLPVECIDITEHFNFNLGNAIKYIWRAGDKGKQVEDLKKAEWYIRREIERLGG